MMEKINVVCVRFVNWNGPKEGVLKRGKFVYDIEYIKKLRNMVSRHITLPYEFYCLTDDPQEVEGVHMIHLPNQGYDMQWWHKLHWFDPSIGLKGRILYLDLDIVIHKNIDKLVDLASDKFYGVREFSRAFVPPGVEWNRLNSSIMSWIGGTHGDLFDKFKQDTSTAMSTALDDQDWLFRNAIERITFWPDSWIQSYRWETAKHTDVYDASNKTFVKQTTLEVPRECAICVFHGHPKPEKVLSNFVISNWC